MNPSVAIIGPGDDDKSVDYLRNALLSKNVEATVCPETEPREILRWAMNLLPSKHNLCIFADTDGRITASVTTALHPDITPLVWCPAPAEPERLINILSDTPALLCFAHDPMVIAGLARNLCNPGSNSSTASVVSGKPRPSATIETVRRQQNATPNPPPPAAGPKADDEDHALYERLEALMKAPLKEVQKPEPVQIQKSGLDFSLPLRRLMTSGRNVAQKNSHPEVLGAHYLAALDEPYLSALQKVGLDIALVKEYLSGFDSGEDITSEPVISDEVFGAVSAAKKQARSSDSSCVRVSDFLQGLLQQKDTSITEILQGSSTSTAELQQVLSQFETVQESCSEPFFKPSSLDQGSFYQFDPAEVRTVETRLRDLPGFQKAAERVAEARGKQAGFAEAQKAAARPEAAKTAIPAAEPPDKPEQLRISGEFPDVDLVEHIADRLLEGHLVVFPSDIMLAAAVDATNPQAIELLRRATDIPPEKPLSILINSTSQLKHLAKADLDALEPLLEELWPGPLTLIFKGAGAAARHIASKGTIAVRQPGDNLSLAILSMLGRPLAVTSWDKPKEQLAGHAAVVVSSDAQPPSTRTTIVDLTQTPWQVTREGAVPGQSVMRFYSDAT